MSKKNEDNKKIVIFDIKEPSQISRHLINPIQFFLRNRYTVYLRLRTELINQFGYYYKLISSKPDLKISIRRPDLYNFYLTNSSKKSEDISLYPDKFGLEEYKKNSHRIPPPMHPLVYDDETFEKIEQFRLQIPEKNYRVVFAGSLIEDGYKSFKWGDDYFINRVQLINKIKSEFPDEIFIPQTLAELQDNHSAAICIVDRKYFSLKIEDYFKFLRQSHFAFCPPGIRVPFSHNLVEAMHVGSIPILQYGHLLSPELVDQKHCLKYWDEESLYNAIERALGMDKNQVLYMSESVKNYYESFLHPDAIVRKFEDSISSGVRSVYLWQESR